MLTLPGPLLLSVPGVVEAALSSLCGAELAWASLHTSPHQDSLLWASTTKI